VGVEWTVNFFHPDEKFKATAEVFERTKELLGRLGEPGMEQIAGPDGTRLRSKLNGLDMAVDPAMDGYRDSWATFHANSAEVPFCDCTVTCYTEPTLCNEDQGETYTTTFSISITFDTNKDLSTEPPATIEAEIRRHMNGVLEEIEGLVGATLVMREGVEG
jgi:hypothetical protein